MLISSVHELYMLEISTLSKQVSLGFAFFVCLILLSICVLGIYHFKTQKHKCLSEYTNGVKERNVCKLYMILFLLRKIILVTWIVTSQNTSPLICAIAATLVQVVYMGWMVVIRPFDEFQNNFVEVVNEIIFSFVLGWLIIFNTESSWNDEITNIYMYILVGNNLIVVGVLLICLIVTVILKIKKCLTKKGQVDNKRKTNLVSIIMKNS